MKGAARKYLFSAICRDQRALAFSRSSVKCAGRVTELKDRFNSTSGSGRQCVSSQGIACPADS